MRVEQGRRVTYGDYNWQHSYQTGILQKIQDLKIERDAQVKRRLYYGTRTYVVKDLTDAQLEELARIEAQRDVEMAINLENERYRKHGVRR